MSHMVGADVAELRQLASTFNARAAQLKSIESQLNWRIHSAPWEGHDVSRFVNDWNTRHRRVITSAAASITNAAQELLANADQQEQASTAGYTGGIASVAALRAGEQRRIGQSPAAGRGFLGGALAGLGVLRSVSKVLDLVSGSVELTGKAINNLPKIARSVEEFIGKNKIALRALKSAGDVVGVVAIASDTWDLFSAIRGGDPADIVVKGTDVAFDVIGKLGPYGLAASIFYTGLTLFRDNTPVGREMARRGADIGTSVWNWGADTARNIDSIVHPAVDRISEGARQVWDAGWGAVSGGPAQRVMDIIDAGHAGGPVINGAGHFVTTAIESGSNFIKSVISRPPWSQ